MDLKPISITELNLYIKKQFEEDDFLKNVYVKGEISNFKLHYSGHMYFTLKDDNSLIKCVMFKTMTGKLDFTPKDGTKVFAFGSVSAYERDGIYQIYCKAMQEDGVGDLHKKYEALKKKLEGQGYFSKENKKQIPFMPKTIGVLTSRTGSVVRDIINVSTRRNPNVNLKIIPVAVQGAGAAEQIAKALKYVNDNNLVDLIIIARGGGSLEDLWPFNEEVLANAIYESNIPIISAVGHETDFTIADFVADLRAPTPSAAAELAVTDVVDLIEKINNYKKRYRLALHRTTELMKMRYGKCMASRVFTDPLYNVKNYYITIDKLVQKMEHNVLSQIKNRKIKAVECFTKLDTLSPLKTLTRGYSIVENDKKEVIRSVKQLKKGDIIDVRLEDGKCKANICEV